MSLIEKYIWEWNNDLSLDLIIGKDFSEIKENYYQDEFNKFNFFSVDQEKYPENILIDKFGKIKLIAFSKNYNNFLFSFNIFDKNSILNNLDKVLKRESNSMHQYKIQCVFREFYLARILIYSSID